MRANKKNLIWCCGNEGHHHAWILSRKNKTMLLLRFCNFFFLLWTDDIYIYKKSYLFKEEEEEKKQPTKPTGEDVWQWRQATSNWLCLCGWVVLPPTPPSTAQTPTVKDQTACLATPPPPPKPSQTLVDVFWQGTNSPDQWIFGVPHFHPVWQTPSPSQTQTDKRPTHDLITPPPPPPLLHSEEIAARDYLLLGEPHCFIFFKWP